MESTHRRVERDIVHLCCSGLDSGELRRAAVQRLRAAVPFDAYCCGTIDPETLLITSEVSDGIPKNAFAVVAENEYLVEDVHKFSELARGGGKVGILSHGVQAAPKPSQRHAFLVRNGMSHELRAAFVTDGNCWGGLTLLRRGDSPDFTAEDAGLLARLSAPLAGGLQAALVFQGSIGCGSEAGPGLIMFDESGEVEAINPAARMWLENLAEPGRIVSDGWLPAPVHEVAMRARAIARAGNTGAAFGQTHGRDKALAETPASRSDMQAHLRVRTRSGQWLMLHGSQMIAKGTGKQQTAVVLERAHSSNLAQLLMLAYDLTQRERDVLQLVLKGLATKDMAVCLRVSSNTVQDHFKSIFDKVGVRSRGELVARVLGEHYLPHFG